MDDFGITLVVFFVGLAAGAGISLVLAPARRQYNKLRRERDEAMASLDSYRNEVDRHFLKTAELVNQLTESYRSVHEHLSGGARQLCSEEGRRQAVTRSLDRPRGEDSASQPAPEEVDQPLDYAPSAKGTLSEEFGLRREYHAEGPFTPVDDLLATTEEPEPQPDSVEPPRDYAEGCEEQGCPPGEQPKQERKA